MNTFNFKKTPNGLSTIIKDKTGRVELVVEPRGGKQYSFALRDVVIEGFQTYICFWPQQKTLVGALAKVEQFLAGRGWERIDAVGCERDVD